MNLSGNGLRICITKCARTHAEFVELQPS